MLAGEGKLTLTAGAALSAPIMLSGSGTLSVGATLSAPAVAMAGSGTLSITAGVAGPETRTLVTALSEATLRALQVDERFDDGAADRIRRIVATVVSEHVAPIEAQVERLTALVTEAQVAGILDSTTSNGELHPLAGDYEADFDTGVTLDELYELQMLTTRWMIQGLESAPRPTLVDKYLLLLAIISLLITFIAL